MKTTKAAGIIAGIRIGAKGASITLTNGVQFPVSLALLPSLALSAGLANTQMLCLFAQGSSISYDKQEIKAGDSMGTDRQGKPIINQREGAMKGTNFYSTDHVRYTNISIGVHPMKLQQAANAMIYGEIQRQLAFEMPVAAPVDSLDENQEEFTEQEQQQEQPQPAGGVLNETIVGA